MRCVATRLTPHTTRVTPHAAHLTSHASRLAHPVQLAAYANKQFLAASLGVSAGVMLYVSFIEIFFKSQGSFQDAGFLEVRREPTRETIAT